jgi:hypothetical protein
MLGRTPLSGKAVDAHDDINSFLVLSSGKFVLLDMLFHHLEGEECKMLVFSNMTKSVSLILHSLR